MTRETGSGPQQAAMSPAQRRSAGMVCVFIYLIRFAIVAFDVEFLRRRREFQTQFFELRIRDRERKLLAKIKEALDRLDNGTYGFCESCEDDISAKRLEARPVTTLCVKCKTAQEQHEKEHAQS